MTDAKALRAKVEKLRAEAEKKANPLAQAEAALAEAETQLARQREERAQEFEQRTANTWQAEAQRLHTEHRHAMRRFTELLAEEPWFAAFLEARAARWKHIHYSSYGTGAHYRATGERLPDGGSGIHPGYHDSPFLDVILREGEQLAKNMAADYMDALEAEREAYINGE
ncbi:hypothetical protein G5C60_03450 [Streptomyces sp. HC44]|uniref:Uncharacterized protein n=1 Tax=Streptomyces scabichelini TaxID=2711217 RepID=A0A6G4UYM6_9ACTN|nr:hypothetical protein [Streptomyces scabichelini]NGO06743.1 hypothetical protein [Streptomyces scabichelini]